MLIKVRTEGCVPGSCGTGPEETSPLNVCDMFHRSEGEMLMCGEGEALPWRRSLFHLFCLSPYNFWNRRGGVRELHCRCYLKGMLFCFKYGSRLHCKCLHSHLNNPRRYLMRWHRRPLSCGWRTRICRTPVGPLRVPAPSLRPHPPIFPVCSPEPGSLVAGEELFWGDGFRNRKFVCVSGRHKCFFYSCVVHNVRI